MAFALEISALKERLQQQLAKMEATHIPGASSETVRYVAADRPHFFPL
jgi:hypothetical protein